MTVSSAYLRMLQWLVGTSLKYIMNRIGPSTEPCGTPQHTGFRLGLPAINNQQLFNNFCSYLFPSEK